MVATHHLGGTFAIVFLALSYASNVAATTPEITGRINDLAGAMSADQEADLEAWILRSWVAFDVETAVLVVADTGELSLEEYTSEVAFGWGLLLAERPEDLPVTAERAEESDPQRRFLVVVVLQDQQLDIDFGGELSACFPEDLEGQVTRAARQAWIRRDLVEAIKDILATVAYLMSPASRECRRTMPSEPYVAPARSGSKGCNLGLGKVVIAVFLVTFYVVSVKTFLGRRKRRHQTRR